jgi:hypothetical protein
MSARATTRRKRHRRHACAIESIRRDLYRQGCRCAAEVRIWSVRGNPFLTVRHEPGCPLRGSREAA